MNEVSAIITAAGRNSRMEKDQSQKNIPIQNKLLLPLNGKTIIENTINNVLLSNVNQCIVVLGHFAEEIKEAITINDDRIKIVENDFINVGLSVSLLNGINNSKSDIVLCLAADQPSVSTFTYNNILKCISNSKNPRKTISILRRKKKGLLKTTEGLGMPFAINRKELANYLNSKNDNLNPILRKMFNDGFIFYGIEEANKYELININRYDDYKLILNNSDKV